MAPLSLPPELNKEYLNSIWISLEVKEGYRKIYKLNSDSKSVHIDIV